MTPQSPEERRTCGACGAPLDGDQRYCLECGARHGAPWIDPLAALGFPEDAAPSPAPPAPAAPLTPSAPRTVRAPSRRMTAALAASTLVLGGLAGAALGPG